jgi:hypothetical protein
MKKAFCILFLVLAVAVAPVFSQVRFNAALAVALLSGDAGIGVIPVSGIHYQIPIEAFKLFAGLRVLPMSRGVSGIPNVVAEFNAGPVILEGQLGGGIVAAFIPSEGFNIEADAVIFPDFSAWYPIDKAKALRVGGGVLGFLDFSRGKYLVAPYLGLKLVVMTP